MMDMMRLDLAMHLKICLIHALVGFGGFEF